MLGSLAHVGEKVVGFDTHDEPEEPVARFDLIV